MAQQKWSLTPEDMGPVLAALELIIDEIDRDLMPDYGIQVAANRVVWKTQLEGLVRKLANPTVTKALERATWIQLPLTAEEASMCGYALLIAANRLDHFVSVEGLRREAEADTPVLPDHTPWMVDLVREHFSVIAHDIAWVRHESLRLRLHAHCLLEHGD
jgi:hypothetical protein